MSKACLVVELPLLLGKIYHSVGTTQAVFVSPGLLSFWHFVRKVVFLQEESLSLS